MESLKKIKDIVEKMSVDTHKVCIKGNQSASIRARKYAQEIKILIGVYRKEVLSEMKKFEEEIKERKQNKKIKKEIKEQDARN